MPSPTYGYGPALRLAFDEAERSLQGDETVTAQGCIAVIKRLLAELAPDEQEILLDQLDRLLSGGNVEGWINSTEPALGAGGGDSRRGRMGMDASWSRRFTGSQQRAFER